MLRRTHIGGPAERVAHLPFRRDSSVDEVVLRLGTEIVDHSPIATSWRGKPAEG